MAATSRKTRSLLTTLIVVLGCGVLGFIFWTSDEYRAATPLVFIFGAVLLAIPAINSLINLFSSPHARTARAAREKASQIETEIRHFWRQGTPELITNLYFGQISHYPTWIKESRDYVPSAVTNAGKTEEGWVRVLMFYADYVFPYKEWRLSEQDDEEYKEAILEVVREGVRLVTMRVIQTPDRHGALHWQPTAIEGLRPGAWVRDFENLKDEIVAIIHDREREAREN